MIYKGYTIEPIAAFDIKFKWYFKYYRDEKINHATTIEEAKKAIDDLTFDGITCNDVQEWLEDNYVNYALNINCSKELKVKVGGANFVVIHGSNVVYDGPFLSDAVDAYNQITTPPDAG